MIATPEPDPTRGATTTVPLRLAPGLSLEVNGPAEVVRRLTRHLKDALGASSSGTTLARVTVTPGPRRAPRFPREPATYSVVRWTEATRAAVEMQRVTATLEWPEQGDHPITATACVAQEDPPALQHVLTLLTSLALPAGGLGALVHASAVLLDERAFLFLGDSGAGKSTTAQRFGLEGARVLADDMILVSIRGNRAVVSPFFGDNNFARLPAKVRRATWPLAGAFSVRKNADSLQVRRDSAEPVTTWLRAFFGPPPPASRTATVLDTAVALAERASPMELLAPGSGALRAALDGCLQGATCPR